MSRADEVVFMECVRCFGKKKRERRTPNAKTCKNGRCIAEYRDERKEGQAEAGSSTPAMSLKRGRVLLDEQSAAYAAFIKTKRCFGIVEVFSVSFVPPDDASMSDRSSRNGILPPNFDYYYLVLGEFGDDHDDALVNGTRWVQLYDLLKFCSDADATKLDTYDACYLRKKSALGWPWQGH